MDAYHGVAHAEVLQVIAELDSAGAYWGAMSLTWRSPEVQDYLDLVGAAHAAAPGYESVVSASVAAAIEGRFGNVDLLDRTRQSTLFINPLMALYWTFDLEAVAARVRYAEAVTSTRHAFETSLALEQWRATLDPMPRPSIPL